MRRETLERKSSYLKGTFMCLLLFSRNTSQFFWKSLKILGRKTQRLREAENPGRNLISLRGFHDGL